MGMLLTYRKGYWPDAEAQDAAKGPDQSSGRKPLSKQNATELAETARAAGLPDEGTKAELLARIREHAGNTNPDPLEPTTDNVVVPETEDSGEVTTDDVDTEADESEQPDPENDPADVDESTEGE